MKSIARTLAVLIAAVGIATAGGEARAADVGPVIAAAINAYIAPSYERLGEEAELTAQTLDALCGAPSPTALQQARNQFAALVHAWARVSPITFGPVRNDNRLERLLLWPDPRGQVPAQVETAIAAHDAGLNDPAVLASKNIELQGLGALEFVLFGTGSDELAVANDGFRCAYGAAIARDIGGIGEALFDAWDADDGIAGRMTDPQPDNPDYRDDDEVLTELIDLFGHGVEAMRANEITPMLGTNPASAKPEAGLFWRSSLTLQALGWQAEGLGDLFLVSGFADLLDADDRWIGGSAAAQLRTFAATTEKLSQPLEAVLADPAGWERANDLRNITISLERLFGLRIAGDLGLDLGFSALDGD